MKKCLLVVMLASCGIAYGMDAEDVSLKTIPKERKDTAIELFKAVNALWQMLDGTRCIDYKRSLLNLDDHSFSSQGFAIRLLREEDGRFFEVPHFFLSPWGFVIGGNQITVVEHCHPDGSHDVQVDYEAFIERFELKKIAGTTFFEVVKFDGKDIPAFVPVDSEKAIEAQQGRKKEWVHLKEKLGDRFLCKRLEAEKDELLEREGRRQRAMEKARRRQPAMLDAFFSGKNVYNSAQYERKTFEEIMEERAKKSSELALYGEDA